MARTPADELTRMFIGAIDMDRAIDALMDEERWPCREYGHFDCASSEGGTCEAEKYALRMKEDEGE